DLVLKDDAFGIIHHEPLIGKVRVCKHLEMVTVADLFLCIDVNPDRFHRSRASLRRPQWGSLRDGLNSRTWPRFDAFMTPIRANILARHVPLPATALPSRPAIPRVVFCARQLSNVYCRIAQREQRLPARHRYRIGKPLIPRHTRWNQMEVVMSRSTHCRELERQSLAMMRTSELAGRSGP